MARYWCERCGEESNTLSEPHLCKDIKRRLARRTKQVNAVIDILADAAVDPQPTRRQLAEEIVAALAHLGVTDD
jgi:hypothetical protein